MTEQLTSQVDRQELLDGDSINVGGQSGLAGRFVIDLSQHWQQPAGQVLLLGERALQPGVPGGAEDVERSARHCVARLKGKRKLVGTIEEGSPVFIRNGAGY